MVNIMYSISITIGRNVGDQPMNEKRWSMFKNEITSQITGLNMEITVSNTGIGEWDGIKEENFIAKGIREKPFADDETDRLAKNLSVLSAKYGQDAIAYSVGSSMLAFAE